MANTHKTIWQNKSVARIVSALANGLQPDDIVAPCDYLSIAKPTLERARPKLKSKKHKLILVKDKKGNTEIFELNYDVLIVRMFTLVLDKFNMVIENAINLYNKFQDSDRLPKDEKAMYKNLEIVVDLLETYILVRYDEPAMNQLKSTIDKIMQINRKIKQRSGSEFFDTYTKNALIKLRTWLVKPKQTPKPLFKKLITKLNELIDSNPRNVLLITSGNPLRWSHLRALVRDISKLRNAKLTDEEIEIIKKELDVILKKIISNNLKEMDLDTAIKIAIGYLFHKSKLELYNDERMTTLKKLTEVFEKIKQYDYYEYYDYFSA